MFPLPHGKSLFRSAWHAAFAATLLCTAACAVTSMTGRGTSLLFAPGALAVRLLGRTSVALPDAEHPDQTLALMTAISFLVYWLLLTVVLHSLAEEEPELPPAEE